MSKAKTPKPAKAPVERTSPTIVIEGHETFERLGMTGTLIDGVEHFLDRSYAENIGRIGYNIHLTIEQNVPELEAYGTLHLVDGVFAVVGNGAKLPIKAYWLNADQMMILAMQSRTPKGVAFRRTLIDLVKALREGRLVHHERALPPSAPKIMPAVKPAPVPTGGLDLRQGEELEMLVQCSDDQRRGIHQPEPFVVDETGALRIRYSQLAEILGVDLRATYNPSRLKRPMVTRAAPLWTRREGGGGFMRYHGDYGLHEAPYYTLGQAVAIAVDLNKGDHDHLVERAFDRFGLILTDYADKQAAWRAQRAEDEARLARAPNLLGLAASNGEKLEKLSADVGKILDLLPAQRATTRPWWAPWRRG